MRQTVIAFFICCLVAGGVFADSSSSFDSGVVNATKPLVAASVVAAYFSDTKNESVGIARAERAMDSIVIAAGTAELLKTQTKTFPSGHASGAFAAASSLSYIYPKQKYLFYGAACIIGYSLVRRGDHSFGDVLGGAALGTASGCASMNSKSGLLFARLKF